MVCIEGDEGERWVVTREQVKRKLGDCIRFVSKEERDLGQYTQSGKKTFKRLKIEETIFGTPHQGPHFPFPFQELPQDPDYQVPHGHLLICNVLTSQKEDWLEISNE